MSALAAIPGLGTAARIGVDSINPMMEQLLQATFPQASFVDGETLLRTVRRVKSDADVDGIRAAVRLAEDCLGAVLDELVPGIRERELVGVFEERMAAGGVTTPAFFGNRTAEREARRDERLPSVGWRPCGDHRIHPSGVGEARVVEHRLHEELPYAPWTRRADEGGEKERQVHPRGSAGEFRREPCRVDDDELRDAIRAVKGDHDREGSSHGVPDNCEPGKVEGVDPRLDGPSVRREGAVLSRQECAPPLAREIGREPRMEQSDRAGDRQPYLCPRRPAVEQNDGEPGGAAAAEVPESDAAGLDESLLDSRGQRSARSRAFAAGPADHGAVPSAPRRDFSLTAVSNGSQRGQIA